MRRLLLVGLLCLVGCQGAYEAVQKAVAAAGSTTFDHLREAVVLDERLNYDEPWGWMEPARHALGALLTEQRRYEEAVAVYEANLACYPENGWALHGLAEGLERLGRKDEAADARARFKTAWADSDTVIPGSCFCRRKPAEA